MSSSGKARNLNVGYKPSSPTCIQQVPDILLHVYTKTFTGEKTIGYERLSAQDSSVNHNHANWFQIKHLAKNCEGKSLGLIMANVRLLRGEARSYEGSETTNALRLGD
jgi:hypothetical protein